MSFQSDPDHFQEVSLADISAIEIQAARLDLVIEADAELDGVARLLSESGAEAPRMIARGGRLRITQEGRYRGMSPPVLKLPDHSHLPTLGASISRGNLSIENIATTLAINIESGNLGIVGGEGECAANVSSGNVSVRQREADLACRIESGDLDLVQCHGDIAVSVSKGNISTRDCTGRLALKVEKGDIALIRPVDQQVTLQGARCNVQIQGGTLKTANVDIARGDINSSARLLFTAPAEPGEDFDDLDDFEDAIDDVVDELIEEVRFNLGSIEFIASDAGVRVSTGGTERFVAGPEGVVIRGRDGDPIFVANEQGVRTGRSSGSRRDEQFRFTTARGNIQVDIPNDQPTRVELIVNRGTVQCDIPLVEVGRPGPRSSTRRYVGVSDSSETDRILIRARTNRGDIRVRTVDAAHEATTQNRAANRERQRRQILEALAQGKLSTDEADILLAAMERDTR